MSPLIIAEDAHVVVTRDGWIKRQKEIKDPAATRLREGDSNRVRSMSPNVP